MNRTELEQALKPLGFTFEDGFPIQHPNFPKWEFHTWQVEYVKTPFEVMDDLIGFVRDATIDACYRVL